MHRVIHKTMWITLQLACSLKLPLGILVISAHPPDFSKNKIWMPEGQDITWSKTCWNSQKAAVIEPECMCTRQEVKIPAWDLALLRRSPFLVGWIPVMGKLRKKHSPNSREGGFVKGVCVLGIGAGVGRVWGGCRCEGKPKRELL